MAAEENDATALDDVAAELDGLQGQLATLEFRRMFQGELDSAKLLPGKFRPDPAAQKPKTGPRCCCACICVGQNSGASALR